MSDWDCDDAMKSKECILNDFLNGVGAESVFFSIFFKCADKIEIIVNIIFIIIFRLNK
jgi:hypothetical protein